MDEANIPPHLRPIYDRYERAGRGDYFIQNVLPSYFQAEQAKQDKAKKGKKGGGGAGAALGTAAAVAAKPIAQAASKYVVGQALGTGAGTAAGTTAATTGAATAAGTGAATTGAATAAGAGAGAGAAGAAGTTAATTGATTAGTAAGTAGAAGAGGGGAAAGGGGASALGAAGTVAGMAALLYGIKLADEHYSPDRTAGRGYVEEFDLAGIANQLGDKGRNLSKDQLREIMNFANDRKLLQTPGHYKTEGGEKGNLHDVRPAFLGIAPHRQFGLTDRNDSRHRFVKEQDARDRGFYSFNADETPDYRNRGINLGVARRNNELWDFVNSMQADPNATTTGSDLIQALAGYQTPGRYQTSGGEMLIHDNDKIHEYFNGAIGPNSKEAYRANREGLDSQGQRAYGYFGPINFNQPKPPEKKTTIIGPNGEEVVVDENLAEALR